MATIRKRSFSEEKIEKTNKKSRIPKETNFNIPLNVNIELSEMTLTEKPIYTKSDVAALLAKKEEEFRKILEEKLKEQYNMFNKFYVDKIFIDTHDYECSYIN